MTTKKPSRPSKTSLAGQTVAIRRGSKPTGHASKPAPGSIK